MVLFIVLVTILWGLAISEKRSLCTFSHSKASSLRFVLSIIVVIHHLAVHGDVEALSMFSRWGNIAVALFFFMSGYGLTKSYYLKGDLYLNNFIKHRVFEVIMLPYLFILICQIIWLGEKIPTLQEYFIGLTLGRILVPNGWYVIIMVILYLVWYIVFKYVNSHKVFAITISVIICILVLLIANFPRYWYTTMLAFPVGIIYSNNEDNLVAWLNNHRAIIWLVPTCMIVVISCFLCHNVVASMIAFIFIILALIFLFASLKIELIIKYKFMAYLSTISYDVYLCHGLIMEIFRGKIKSLYINSDLIYVMVVIFITILSASLLHSFCSLFRRIWEKQKAQ